MATSVFVSYAHKNTKFVEQLVHDLEVHNVPIWWDKSLLGGANWQQSIDKRLDGTTHVIVVLSSDSIASEYVAYEWKRALELRKTVIPLRYEECEMPTELAPLQWVDFVSGYVKPSKKLLAVLFNQGLTEEISVSADLEAILRELDEREDTPLAHRAKRISDLLVNAKNDYKNVSQKLDELVKQHPRATTNVWEAVVFSEKVDEAIAELAYSNPDGVARQQAIAWCVKIRSLHTLKYLVGKIGGDNKDAVGEALARIREQIDFPPTLAGIDPLTYQLVCRNAFIRASWRQLLKYPGDLIQRFIYASTGFGLALGSVIFMTYGTGTEMYIRFLSALALGIAIGLLMGGAITSAIEISIRLCIWKPIERLLLALGIGTGLSSIAFLLLSLSYAQRIDPVLLILGACLFISGFVMTPLPLIRQRLLMPLTAFMTMAAALYLTAMLNGPDRQGWYQGLVFLESSPQTFSLLIAALTVGGACYLEFDRFRRIVSGHSMVEVEDCESAAR